MRYIYKISTLFLLTIFTIRGFSQIENTLYFMERIPQSQYLNPANHPDCKAWAGGLLIPVWEVPMIDPPFIHLPIYMDISMPLSLSDYVIYENGKPSRLFARNTDLQEKFLKKLDPINNISNNLSLEWLNIGFKQGKNYWSFNLMTKYNFIYSYPKEIFELPIHGNVERDNNGVFDGIGVNSTAYQEAAIGFNRQFSRYFRVGLRVKGIFGIANVNTANSKFTTAEITKTDDELVNENGYLPMTLTTNADMLINSSIPLAEITTDTNNVPNDIKTPDKITPKDIFKNKNYGWGIDFGFQKDWNSELTFFGSIVDFGVIHWKNNVQNFNLSGKYSFSGLSVNNFDIENINADSLLDEFFDGYKAEKTTNKYTTKLNTKIFFGGNYKLTKKVAIGVVGRMDKNPFNWEYSATASLNLKPFRWGALSLSSSYYKKSFYNFGIGYTIRIAAMQWYAVYDNLIGTAIMPERSRYFSMRWGVNLVFGRGKKKVIDKNKPLLYTL